MLTLITVTASPYVTQFIITLLLPVLVALATKASADERVKAVVLLLLTAITQLVTSAVTDTGTAVISSDTFMSWILSTLIAVAMYVGVYKPAIKLNEKKLVLPTKGLGGSGG